MAQPLKKKEVKKFNINDFKSLHGIMMKYLVDEAGEFRKGVNYEKINS